VFHGQDLVADFTERAEINVRILTAGGTDVIQLNLLKCALTGSCLLGFGGIGRETLDEFLQLLNLLFLFAVGFLHLLNNQLAGLYPEIVVSRKQLDLAIINIRNLRADLVEEVTVMGHHDYRILKINQELFQPCNGIQVQMVGRLVQKQYIRIAEQGLGQQHLYLLGAQQAAHLGIVKVSLNTKAV